MKNKYLALLSSSLLIVTLPIVAAPLPTKVGQCSNTTVKWVGSRLEDGQTHQPISSSGSAITFTNGGYQVSYETVPAIEQSQSGDAVKLCLKSIPQHCPPGDHRGRFYQTRNLRTGKSWVLPDSEHLCGGA